MKKHLIFLLSFSLLISLSCNTLGCTIFTASNTDTVLVGNNEDWNNINTRVWFLPAEHGKFGRVFFGFNNAYPQGGMNERGLFYDAVRFTIKITKAPLVPQKLNYKGNLAEKILEECSTVDQALILCRKFNEPVLGYAKFMFVDSNGDSAIVGWDWSRNELSIVRKNNNYHVFGTGQGIIEYLFEKDSLNISIERFRSMLDLAHQEFKTVYSNIYNLKKREVYVYNQYNFDKVVKFKLADELQKGKHFYQLPELFPKKQPNFVVNYYKKNYYSIIHKILILFFIVVLLSPFIKWPKAYFLKRRKYTPEEPIQNKRLSLAARLLVAFNSIISLILLSYIIEYPDFIRKYGLSICGFFIGLLPVVITILVIGEIILLTILWQRKYWTLNERVYYLLLTLTKIFELMLFLNLNYVVKL